MTQNKPHNWIPLAAVGGKAKFAFVAVFDRKHNSLFAIHNRKGLIQYSFDKNSWIKHTGTPSFKIANLSLKYKHAIGFNCEQQKIYMNHKSGSIAILTVGSDNKSQFGIVNKLPHLGTGRGSTGIMVGNDLHIIGGANNNKHLKYDTNTQTLHVLHHLSHIMGISNVYGHQLVQAGNKILMLGGEDINSNPLNAMFEYNIAENKWRRLKHKLPKPLETFGCTLILNGQFVAIFGGYYYGDQDDIFIYSVHDEIFKKSKLKCPIKECYQAFAVIDRKKDELATLGFVRCKWGECGIKDFLYPPEYLIRIMYRYYWNEYIHLLDPPNGGHHKIDVFALLY